MSTRTIVGRLVIALIISATPLALLASSPHYKKGGQPVCTADGATVTCSTGTVTGLGNFDVQVSISFTASQGQLCHNKGNPSNIVPGQNPAIGTGGGGVSIPAADIKNGNLVIPSFSGTATLTAGDAASAGCSTGNWTVTPPGQICVTCCVYSFKLP